MALIRPPRCVTEMGVTHYAARWSSDFPSRRQRRRDDPLPRKGLDVLYRKSGILALGLRECGGAGLFSHLFQAGLGETGPDQFGFVLDDLTIDFSSLVPLP